MKRVLIWMVLIGTLLAACSKSSSGPTSAEGSWTYTTADSKISVTFQLVKNSSGSLDIQNQTFKLNGTVYESAAVISGVALPAIASIKINANDAKLTYPYYILFTGITVSSDFKKMNVPTGEYQTQSGTVSLSAVSITRP